MTRVVGEFRVKKGKSVRVFVDEQVYLTVAPRKEKWRLLVIRVDEYE